MSASCRCSWRTSSGATTRSSSTPSFYGADAAPLNLAFDADPEIGKWLTNVDFRRALSLGIDRDQINEAFFLGLGRAQLADVRRRLA